MKTDVLCAWIVAFVSLFQLQAMQQVGYKQNLQGLPQEIIQNVMLQLSTTIGSPEVVNEKDIPVIIKNIVRLSQVNKGFYEILNTEDTTDMLLKALKQRFKISPLDVAAQLKTQGAKKWLKRYIHTSGDYDQYLILQKIYDIAEQVIQEAKVYDVSLRSGKKGWSSPNPYYHQTRQGFFLTVGSYPDSLWTPWGQIKLFGSGSGSYLGFMAVTQNFLKRFDWQFDTIQGLNSQERGLVFRELVHPFTGNEIHNIARENVLTPISRDAIVAKQGKNVLIFADICGYDAIYKLFKVDHALLPDPIMLSKDQYRSYETINVLWKLMEDEYKQSQQTKMDVSEECEEKSASCTYEKEKRSLPAPYEVVPATALRTMSQVPDLCVQLIKKLAAQPLFTGKGMITSKGKALPLASWNECRLCELMTNAANSFFERSQQWHVHTFGCGNSQLYIYNQCLGDGLQLWLYENDAPVSFEELRKAYERVLHELKQGWVPTTLQENPHILHKQSEEEWYLFITKNHRFNDATLIATIADAVGLYHQFGSHNKISVGDDWKRQGGERRDVYLWIRKDSLHEFEQAFGFNLQPHPSWNMGNRFRKSTVIEQSQEKSDVEMLS